MTKVPSPEVASIELSPLSMMPRNTVAANEMRALIAYLVPGVTGCSRSAEPVRSLRHVAQVSEQAKLRNAPGRSALGGECPLPA